MVAPPGVADPVIALIDMLQGVQEVDSILVALEDSLPLIAPGGDVIDSAGALYKERTGHKMKNSRGKYKSQTLKTTPEVSYNRIGKPICFK